MNSYYKTADTYKQGARSLPQKYYMEDAIFKMEIKNIFEKKWLCCGRSNDILKPGQYQLVNIGDESIIILRDDQLNLQGFYNICRHRGTRLCKKEKGKFSKTIQCPYHGWTYNLQGNLCGAPNMDAVKEFEKNDYPLHQVYVKEWEGFYFINLTDTPEDFEMAFSPILNYFSQWDILDLKTIDTKTYYVNCNWKLIIQNYSECYHCPIIHSSLAEITPYTGGKNNMVSGPFLGGYMEMKFESITTNGKLSGPKIGNLSKENLSRVYYYTLFPNMLLSLHPDYIMYHTIYPISPEKCQISCSWLFSNKVENNLNYNPHNAINFWNKTNLEDWEICEKSQLGIKSKKYKPGPYSGQESLLAAYDEYYLNILNNS